MPTDLIFLRHAESTGNVAAKTRPETAFTDKTLVECPLSEAGIQQTLDARALHQAAGYDLIYCSPARRCIQTLLGVLPESAEMPVRVDSRLLEYRGIAEFNEMGTPDFPAAWDLNAYSATDPRNPKERERDVEKRVIAWWGDCIRGSALKKKILVVTHSFVISIWAATYPEEDVHVPNCCTLELKGWLS
jgi:broad specificity phosphatase PhoE